MLVFASVVLALGGVASATPGLRRSSKVKESINVPRNWVNVGTPPADHKINLRIAFPQPNFATLESHLYEVSDPSHPRYGAHLSKEEVDELVKPHGESVDAVSRWLEEHNIQESDCARGPDWVKVKVPVSMAEKMLDTVSRRSVVLDPLSPLMRGRVSQKYYMWQHAVDGDVIVRTTSYALPEDLHEHVSGVQPTVCSSLVVTSPWLS